MRFAKRRNRKFQRFMRAPIIRAAFVERFAVKDIIRKGRLTERKRERGMIARDHWRASAFTNTLFTRGCNKERAIGCGEIQRVS